MKLIACAMFTLTIAVAGFTGINPVAAVHGSPLGQHKSPVVFYSPVVVGFGKVL